MPTRSSDGARVSSPSSHLAGQTSPGWARDVLGGLHLAEQLGGVAADALGGDLDELDDAVGVDHERAAVGEALALAQHVEVAADRRAVGSPIIGYWILPIVSEVSCHALWVKWVSVDTE